MTNQTHIEQDANSDILGYATKGDALQPIGPIQNDRK